jgi:hypothetical protein
MNLLGASKNRPPRTSPESRFSNGVSRRIASRRSREGPNFRTSISRWFESHCRSGQPIKIWITWVFHSTNVRVALRSTERNGSGNTPLVSVASLLSAQRQRVPRPQSATMAPLSVCAARSRSYTDSAAALGLLRGTTPAARSIAARAWHNRLRASTRPRGSANPA